MNEAPRVIDNQDESRFEVTLNDTLAELVYRRRADRLVLLHTGVPEALGGHGIGGLLVRAASERAAREGLTIVPLCPFARSWLEKHPDIASGVSVDWGPPPDD
jgi:predicted GNAT family acetyltransferase